jgi:hypothetical protein
MVDDAELDTFSFDADTHRYVNARGQERPSVTQTLQAGGLFDFSRINPAVLERKRLIGSEVHAWTAAYDQAILEFPHHSRMWPWMDSVSEEAERYCAAWIKFRSEIAFTTLGIEVQMLKPVMGLELGGTYDRKVRIGNRIHILEIKTVASFHHAWRLQLADYVMQDTGRSNCSMYARSVVRLLNNGTYRFDTIDPQWDETDSAVAVAFAQTYMWKKNHNLL